MPKLNVGSDNKNPVELYYEDFGAGPPVVLIHGWPLSGRAWEAQIGALVGAGFRTITYDRRGFGESTRTWGGYDYDTFTSDLDGLMRHLDLRAATLVGFSMGGGEVARYVGKYSTERVSKAVFAGAVPPFLLKSQNNPEGGLDEATIAHFKTAVTRDRLAFLEEFTRSFFSAKGELKVSEAQRAHALRIAAMASPKGTLDCIDAWGRTDFRADLARFSVPTLVIHGDADGIVPFEVSGKRTAATIPGAKLEVIKDGPHGLNTSHAEIFNRALLGFLKG